MGNIYNRGLRNKAKLRGEVHYFTGKPCSKGHIEKRSTVNGSCMECARLKTASDRKKETGEQRAIRLQKSTDRAAEWRKNNPHHENTKIVKARWALENKNIVNLKNKIYRSNNKEKYAEWGKNWRKNNLAKNSAKTMKRYADKLQRTPVWLNDSHWLEINSIYELCAAWRSVGFDYHVDHIVPLVGKNVSGFHAPWNLQIISAKENLAKGNRI